MTRSTMAFAAAVLGVVGIALSGAHGAPGSAAGAQASQGMYRAEEVLGTLLDATMMYSEEGVVWHSGELRVDETEADGNLSVGGAVNVKYQVRADVPPIGRPGVGDQVRATLKPEGSGAKGVWLAEGLEVVGRGELVRPGKGAVVDLGSADARLLVKIVALLGSECHRKTVDLLGELAARDGDRVRVQMFDIARPEGREEMLRERLSCATVLINNRFEFTLPGPSKVKLSGRPNYQMSTYRSEDVIAVVEQETGRLYPE